MSSRNLVDFSHRAAIRMIGSLPPSLSVFSFRSVNYVLRRLKKDYRTRTFFGASIRCNATDLIQTMILHFGAWEPNISRTIERILKPGDTFLDIGENIGYHTLLGSRLVGPAGRVIAIEASPRIFDVLARHLAENGAANVDPINVAVSDRAGTLTLYDGGAFNLGSATTLPSRGLPAIGTVQALPLDQILSPADRSRIRLIKMDVEGAEPQILRQILADLGSFPRDMDLIVEVSPRDNRPEWEDIFHRMFACGFTAHAIENDYTSLWYLKWRRPSPFVRITELPGDTADILFTRGAPPDITTPR